MLIDISRTLNPGIAVWPGDTRFSLQTRWSMAAGSPVNLTTLTLSAHTGTHVDAPFHFDQAGATLDQVALAPYWGLAQVVTIHRATGALAPSDFAHVDIARSPRLLVRSARPANSARSAYDPSLFMTEIVYPTPALADWLGHQGVVLYGTDAPSMDPVQSKDLPGHHALRRNGIAILEGLDLRAAPDGVYELVALPLKIEGGDGSPVRAVLRMIE